MHNCQDKNVCRKLEFFQLFLAKNINFYMIFHFLDDAESVKFRSEHVPVHPRPQAADPDFSGNLKFGFQKKNRQYE